MASSGRSVFGAFAAGPSPRKKIKVEEVPAATTEIAETRKLVLDEKLQQMLDLKENYFDHLTECFFLQNGGGLMDYYSWRKRPTPQLVHFLKSGRLDSDDEDEDPVIYLKESRESDEIKANGNSSSVSVTPDGGSQALSSQHNLHRSVSDSRLTTLASQSHRLTGSSSQTSTVKKSLSPGSQKQASFDGTTIKGISSQEAIVERAKQEAQVMSRVAELRKEGLWSSRRLPKVQEPPRPKAHWDYLLEEMQWLAADFLQERKWKKTCARKIAKMVQKYFQDLEQKELRAEKEEGMRMKRIASNMAKMVREFWSNIEKVVQYKQNSRLDEKRKKAMDIHLNFIVNQTEQYSTWLSEGLTQASSVGSRTPEHSLAGDDEFKPDVESESDDEETIDKVEQDIDESEYQDEIAALQKESELPIEELIETLPKEILEKPASIHSESDSEEEPEESPSKKDGDEEFEANSEEDSDVEETIDEQEQHEAADYEQELDELKDEGEMDIEALRAKYAAAYDSDFEMPRASDEESTDINASDDDEDEDEDDEEEEEEEEEEMDTEEQDVGLEALVDSEDKSKDEDGPSQELTDIAAQAASLQPKGYTLQTTEVKTSVPFLLKHSLREYQHVGLDWLATMYEKRLNGILADEMGLGKTIQTIALIAHLACEKGIWGPHLIVVPTSVMLNWEMEFKKWCPAFKILTYYGSQKERKLKRQGWTKTNAFHICITSYKLVIQDHNAFRRKKWKYLILDEAQNIKNFKSQRWQCLLNFNSMRRLLLTGTPLQNSLMELWSLMHFLMPHVFQSHKDFKEWFANPLTGMIEGSHEYNENLIRRLHKVLRPFLLRRLKDDVEKQMPKKYEHVVMCHLSKRQRFLYDEFMAQGKTKETLATGHFMSVINILMQLRKVCNHPSLFDPRPIISPFQMEGIVFHTASLVLKVLQYDPFNDINLQHYPGLAEMERDLPAFIAHRVRKLQTHRRLIEEIEVQQSPPPRPPAGKLKPSSIRCVSPAVQSGRASPAVNSRSVSPAPVIKPVNTQAAVVGSSQPPLQATVAPLQASLGVSTAGMQPPSSQPITVQIQHTEQGTRLVVPSSQLSNLPGFIQIVQSSASQTLATSSVVTTSALVNGSPVVTMASSSLKTLVSSSATQVKMSAGIQSGTGTPSVQLSSGTNGQGQKPVMRVSPLSDGLQGRIGTDGVVFTAASTASSLTFVTSSTSKPVAAVSSTRMIKHLQESKTKLSSTEFFFEPLYDKQLCAQRQKLQYIARTNKQHCERKPVYGADLCEAVNIFRDPYSSFTYKNRDKTKWNGSGHIHCHCAKLCSNRNHPRYLWNPTSVLSDIIHTPEQYLQELETILDRFVFVTPPVQSQRVRMHVSHPPPSYLQEERFREAVFRTELSPKTAHYHKICTKMNVQFPELRLIQYDCGKLQTLDILLHRLKTEDHRVLIFTQMTRMLDILEAFLNYHGHRYLRLDGTTKIEQRQQLMDRFNADRRIFVFILSTRSGGIGVNLTGADTVIFYDSDWNPTMDAQAQDRCHRIGQTRDVHIYRLVSERTVEENILKKANQKRMLGDMAIEGGNFTTAFFKENTITELFSEPSGLESLVEEKEKEEREKQQRADSKKAEQKKPDPAESLALAQFEKALANTEEETDVVAIEQVKAEQKAELAEFDESIPLDEGGEGQPREDESHVEQELAMLDKELTPIERYAVQLTEQMMEPVNEEELKIAEDDIEEIKKDWELNRLKALKEEEERRAELEEDEMLYTYSRDDAYQQVKKRNRQLAMEARRAAAEDQAQSLSLSPRRPGRPSLGARDELEESPSKKQWVYKTPKIIRDLVKNKNVDTGRRGRENGEEYDTNEDVDIETVDVIEDNTKQKVRKKVAKLEKSPVKRQKKVKVENNIVHTSPGHSVASTEATRLDSLPGYTLSSVRENIFQRLQSPTKSVADRANIFEQFGVQGPPTHPPHSFPSISHNINVVQSPGQAPVFSSSVTGQTVRLINTAQGRQMVVVSSNPTAFQQANPQNMVLLQGMQGFPQGIVVGNNILSLQGTPLQVASVGRGVNPINVQGQRLVAFPQMLQQTRLGTRIVSPVGVQNQAFIQRLVGSQQINTGVVPVSQVNPGLIQVSQMSQINTGMVPVTQITSGMVSVTQINTGIVPVSQINTGMVQLSQISSGMVPVSVSVPQLSPQASIVQQQAQQLASLPQFRVQNPLVHTSGGQMVSIQTLAAPVHRKSNVQTIANLIAAGRIAKHTVPQPSPNIPTQQHSPRKTNASIPNLANLMKPQIPHTSPSPSSTHVRVNPTVAKLVASHIHQAALCGSGTGSVTQSSVVTSTRAPSPAIINLGSNSRSQSPTVVKVVSVSRTSSPSPNVSNSASTPQPGRPQPAHSVPRPQRAENPVATINIKGLPPGVSIPASLVNSLVSGSIGGISKGGLIRGIVPGVQAPTSGAKTVVRRSVLDQPNSPALNEDSTNMIKPQITTNGGLGTNVHVASPKADTPDYRVLAGLKPNPDSASSSPASPNAWSNPNLVIRTRRAAVKPPTTQPRSPQVGPSPMAPSPLEIPTVVSEMNGPVLLNHVLQNHLEESPGFVTVEVETSAAQDVPDSNGNNKSMDVIEIS